MQHEQEMLGGGRSVEMIELKPNHYAHSRTATLEAARGFADRVNGLNV